MASLPPVRESLHDKDIIAAMREFFGPIVDTWCSDNQCLVLCDWIKTMQKAGNQMMVSHGRNGIPSPCEAISFDSPKSFMDSLGYPHYPKDYVPHPPKE